MKKASGVVFGLIGAILLLLPVAATAGPLLPGEPVGTQLFCAGSQSNAKSSTISAALGRVQPLRVHGTCTETLSISDTRTNITIIGDGGDVLRNGHACADGLNTIIKGEDVTQSQIIQVRGKNITITGVEVIGQSISDVDTSPGGFYEKKLGLFDTIDFDSAQCGSGLASDPLCNNNRGIRAQRGGTLLLGRNQAVGSFQPKLTASTDNHNPRQYEEKTGVCIHDVGSNGMEFTQTSLGRIINSEVHNVGGDAIVVTETSHATVGFSSGGELGLTNAAFPGPGNAGPNYIHNNTGNGVSVQRNSYGRIVGNSIISNGGVGVAVTRGGGADVADNVINGNTSFGVDVNDNSQVNLGTTRSTACSLAVAPGNTIPASIGGGGTGPALPTAAGTQCPGGGVNSGVQNTGTTGSGVVNLGNLVNSVTANNTAGGIRCQRSYIAGRSSINRDGSAAGLASNTGATFTSCVSSLN